MSASANIEEVDARGEVRANSEIEAIPSESSKQDTVIDHCPPDIKKNVTFEETDDKNRSNGVVDGSEGTFTLANLADRVESFGRGMPQEERQYMIDTFESILKMQLDMQKSNGVLKRDFDQLSKENAKLNTENTRYKNHQEQTTGKLSEEISDALNDILLHYNGRAMDSKSKNDFRQNLCKHPEFVESLQGLKTATFAMSAQRELVNAQNSAYVARQHEHARETSSITGRLREYQRELSMLTDAGASQPIETGAEHARRAASGRAPIEVAASHNTLREVEKTWALPEALRNNIRAYDANCGPGKLVPADFNYQPDQKKQKFV